MTFRAVSILFFLIVLGFMALHAIMFPFSASGRWRLSDIVRTKVHVCTLLLLEQKLNGIGRLKKLVFWLGLLSFAVLLVTGFGPLLLGYRLSGWLLMIHATFAPILIGCIALLAVGWAHAMRFQKEDFRPPSAGCWLTDSGAAEKGCFWGLVFLSLPLTLSMILSMFNFFGTEGQEFLLVLHRWCALVFAGLMMIFLYVLVRRQISRENKQQTLV